MIDSVKTHGIKLVSAARKVIFKVHQEGAEEIKAPEGKKLNEYSQALTGMGVVVCNGTDGTYQGADINGNVLVNEVPEAHAVAALTEFDADKSVTNLKCVLAKLAATEVENADGTKRLLNDQYTCPADFYAEQLSPAGMMLADGSGVMVRSSRDTAYVLNVDGVLRIAVPQGKGHVLRDITPEILERTYRLPNGDKVDASKVPVMS